MRFPPTSLPRPHQVYNLKDKDQRFYQGHTAEVTCVAAHPKGFIVATADVDSNIHVWSAHSLSAICVIKGIVKQGIRYPVGRTLAKLRRCRAPPGHAKNIPPLMPSPCPLSGPPALSCHSL